MTAIGQNAGNKFTDKLIRLRNQNACHRLARAEQCSQGIECYNR